MAAHRHASIGPALISAGNKDSGVREVSNRQASIGPALISAGNGTSYFNSSRATKRFNWAGADQRRKSLVKFVSSRSSKGLQLGRR